MLIRSANVVLAITTVFGNIVEIFCVEKLIKEKTFPGIAKNMAEQWSKYLK